MINTILHILNGQSSRYQNITNIKEIILNKYPTPYLMRSNILHFPKQLYFGNFCFEDTIETWVGKWESYFKQDITTKLEPDIFDIESQYVFSCFLKMLQETEFKEIIIWSTASLKDQLYFVWVITIIKKLAINLNKVKVKCITYNNSFVSRSIAEFNPEMFTKRVNDTYQITSNQADYITQVWKSLNAKTPKPFLKTLNNSSFWYSLLHHKLQNLFLFFPEKTKGISIWVERILMGCKKKNVLISSVMGSVEGRYEDSLGYAWIKSVLYNFSQHSNLKEPLCEYKKATDKNMALVSITDFGKQVLDGKINNLFYNDYPCSIFSMSAYSNATSVWCFNIKTNQLEENKIYKKDV